MGNEMGNSNASGLQEQDNDELQAPNKSLEASMPSNVADGVEDELSALPSEAEGFHEKLEESASVDLSETSDHQMQKQTSTESEEENAKLQPPNKSLDALMPSNDADGVGDENLSALLSNVEDLHEKHVKPPEIGVIEKNISALPSEVDNVNEYPVRPSEIADHHIENQESTGIEEEIKASKQTSTCELISTESGNQNIHEHESIASSAKSCAENSSDLIHDNVTGSNGSCDSNEKGDTKEILEECTSSHSDVEVEKNVKDTMTEETENHKKKVSDTVDTSGECYEKFVQVENGYGLIRVSTVQSGGLENGDEQQNELDLVMNYSTELPLENSFDSSYREAIESEIKRVCLENHVKAIQNDFEIESNENNQDPTLISEKGKESVEESKTDENGKGTVHGDKKEDWNHGFCSSGIERGFEVDKETEIERRFGIERHDNCPCSDLEKEKEMIDISTSLTEHSITDSNCKEKKEAVDVESFSVAKLLERNETKGMEVTIQSLPLSDSNWKDVELILAQSDPTQHATIVEEETTEPFILQSDPIEQETIVDGEKAEPNLLQSDPTQQATIVEEDTIEPFILQSNPIEQETIVEGEKTEPILLQSDPIQQETILVQAYLASLDHSQEPERELTLSESERSIIDSGEEKCTKVDHAKSFDINSSNPTFDTSVSAPGLEDPAPSQTSTQVAEISSCRSGELFAVSMHQTKEQKKMCGLMALEGDLDPNMDSEKLENSDTFSFELENPFTETQAPELQSQEEFEKKPLLHLCAETVRGEDSASERDLTELDRKSLSVPVEVIKTDVSILEVQIEESEKHQLLQQPRSTNFRSEFENTNAGNRVSVLKESEEESAKTTMLHLKTSAGSEVSALEIRDSGKLRKTPIQRILKEETCVVEVSKESIGLKETVEVWKSPKKVTSTSPGERKKRKPRYSLFGNCMCCTTVIH